MKHLKPFQFFILLLFLSVFVPMTVLGQTIAQDQKDSAAGARIATIDEMAKRVDSLQFIVVYNGELLRRNLDSKMILIFVMLGIIIVASVLMYGLLKQLHRQRQELEEKIFRQLSSSVSDLEAKIKHIEAELSPPKPVARKKKTK